MTFTRHTAISVFCLFLISSLTAQVQNVRIHTDAGDIFLELYADKAPVTVSNFLKYVDGKLYDGALFYRVVRTDNQPDKKEKIEVIQGGLINKDSLKRMPPIIQETTDKTGIKHQDGTISMARSTPASASSEFFICVNNQPELNFGGNRNPDGQGFAAFGKVTKGMEIVRKIQAGKTGENEKIQLLVEPVKIMTIDRVK